VTLIERESQVGSLLQYAEEARVSTGRLVLVSGEAGVGKSSLVEELQRRLIHATWAWGLCDGLFTPRPLGPVHDMARELGGPLLDAVRASASRDEIFDAVLQTASAVADLGVLVVEDVQWADEATLDLLRFLGRRIAKLPVLLLVTFRDDALAPDDRLRLALGELAGQRCTRRIDLPPLTAAGVGRLTEGTSHSASEVYALTGGNPFFVTELVASEGSGVPVSARDAVLARAARLSEDARAALDLASLDSWRVDPGLLTRAGDVPPSCFEELVVAGLLRSDGLTLRFRHELSRRAIESEVRPHRRSAGHRALLTVLTADGCDDEARLAYHAEGAGDAELVGTFAPRAARRAADLGAHRESAAQYERALRFPPQDPRALAELYDAVAEQAGLLDDWPRAAQAHERAIELWHELGDVRREGLDHGRLRTVYWNQARGQESVASLERALTLLQPLGPDPALARLLATRGTQVWSDDPVEGRAMVDRALAMVATFDDPAARGDVLNTAAFAARLGGEDWRPHMQESVRLLVASGAHDEAGRAYYNLLAYCVTEFAHAESEQYWLEGIAYCEENELATWARCLCGLRAMDLLDRGQWDEVISVTDRVFATQPGPVALLVSQLTSGLVLARRGQRGASELLNAAAETADGVGEAGWIALTRRACAEDRWLVGDDEGARQEIDRVRAVLTLSDADEDAPTAVWERRLFGTSRAEFPAVEPWATWLTASPEVAAARWDDLGCPYYAALALSDSELEPDLREAIVRFDTLGADGAARRTRQKMKDLGYRAVPTGARPATREHPLGLTRREDEVLKLLCEGLTNDEIATKLVLSTRTVGHHVSAVLTKLAVSSRGAAVAEARRRGLVPAGTQVVHAASGFRTRRAR
jgi:DNA-binding CsgD family transcriptional regulator/tetratricopeptide (TPR) repeat protein